MIIQTNLGNQNTQLTGQNSVSQLVETPKKPKIKHQIIGFLVLFVLVSVFFVARLLVIGTGSKVSLTETKSGKEAVSFDAPTRPGFTKYQNLTYNFEFQYPTTFMYQKSDGSLDSRGNAILASFKMGDDKELRVSLDSTSFSVDYLKKYAPGGSRDQNPVASVIEGNTFYYYGVGKSVFCYPDQYFVNLNGKILIFNFSGCDNEKTPSAETKAIEKQILSTFKF